MNLWGQSKRIHKILALSFSAGLLLLVSSAKADSEIVIAIRYLQADGISHAHLYLYRADGKLLRQLTDDNSGQDVDPIFAPDGETIVFTREKAHDAREFWVIDLSSRAVRKLEAAPEWYTATKSSAYFVWGDEQPEQESISPSATPEKQVEPPSYKSPDGSVELILRTVGSDEEDQTNGPGHGKHFLLRNLKSGKETEMGKLPGFYGLFAMLQASDNKERRFLFEQPLRVALFGLHLNSTDGDTVFALDLNGPRLVRLSPNWAAAIPLPAEPAFLTLTSNRYIPIPGSSKIANCSYIERWDAQLAKIRYARKGSAAICYGMSTFRPGAALKRVTIRKSSD